MFLGERPVSVRELRSILARLARRVAAAPPGARADWGRREIARLRQLLSDSAPSGGGAAASWQAETYATSAASERITSNGLADIDAMSHPFAAGRHGQLMRRGAAGRLVATGVAGLGSHLAAVLQPMLTASLSRDDSAPAERALHRGYVRGVWGNVALRVGFDELHWGQSPAGALFISGHAAPLPVVSVGTDTPITLPWLLRHAGPVRGTLLVADLGGDRIPAHDKLAGWQVSITPWSRFELGVASVSQTGGNGGPPATFFQRVVDLFPVIDALAPQHADLQISNKLSGGNLRLRFPELSGLDVYYELQIDDFDARRLHSSLVDDAAHLIGLRLPLLVGGGQLAWRAEWHRTSLRLYEHGQFRSGYTHHRRLIGDPLGPHALGAYLGATWQPSPGRMFDLAVADERRDPSLYHTEASDARDRGFRFVRDSVIPDYRRIRSAVSADLPLRFGALRVTLGMNRAWRAGGPHRDELLAQLVVRSQALPWF